MSHAFSDTEQDPWHESQTTIPNANGFGADIVHDGHGAAPAGSDASPRKAPGPVLEMDHEDAHDGEDEAAAATRSSDARGVSRVSLVA